MERKINNALETSSIVLILTGTIKPHEANLTLYNDINKRKLDYIKSLDFYLKNTNLNIVFCENSGYNLNNDINLDDYNNRLEYLTFNGSDLIKEKGKGYGEIEILEYALKYSSFLKNASFIIKITGRLRILNLDKLLHLFNSNKRKDIILNLYSPWGGVATECFLIKKSFLSQIIINYKDKINDRSFQIEDVILDAIINSKDIKVHKFFPYIKGICGGDLTYYKKESTYRLKGNYYYCLRYIQKQKGYMFKSFLSYLNYCYFRMINIIID